MHSRTTLYIVLDRTTDRPARRPSTALRFVPATSTLSGLCSAMRASLVATASLINHRLGDHAFPMSIAAELPCPGLRRRIGEDDGECPRPPA